MKQSGWKRSIKQTQKFLEKWLETFTLENSEAVRPTKESLKQYKLTGEESFEDIKVKIEICKRDLKNIEDWL